MTLEHKLPKEFFEAKNESGLPMPMPTPQNASQNNVAPIPNQLQQSTAEIDSHSHAVSNTVDATVTSSNAK